MSLTSARDDGRIFPFLVLALLVEPGLSAIELSAALGRAGVAASKSQVNSVLYRHREAFERKGEFPPRWTIRSGFEPPSVVSDILARNGEQSLDSAGVELEPVRQTARTAPETGTASIPDDLWDWQRDALAAWEEAGFQGVVEAVTGTGKTRLAIAAAAHVLDAGGQVLVLVPTKELQRQWSSQLRERFPRHQVGELGGGSEATFRRHDVVVAVVNSARDQTRLGVPRSPSLLIADECHRYGSEQNALALSEHFEERLGLTATFERNDDGLEDHLLPYFGEVCFEYGYDSAVPEGVTAPFNVALIGLRFEGDEAALYDDARESAAKARYWLFKHGWVVEEPFGEFIHDVELIDRKKVVRGRVPDFQAVRQAGKYLKNFNDQRRVLAEARAKPRALEGLAEAIRASNGTLLFSETTKAADQAAEILRQSGVSAESIHSKLNDHERRAVLDAFAAGRLKAICAAKVLDEGIDVPEADLAVVLAASKTKRQMIQRMGRVLRRKTDGRKARFAITFIEGSAEDPDEGAHLGFLDEVTDAADLVVRANSNDPIEAVVRYLNDAGLDAPLVPEHTNPAPPRSRPRSPGVSSGRTVRRRRRCEICNLELPLVGDCPYC